MAQVETFYRYIRPCRFDEKRMDYITLPTGGVCLRFEQVGDSLFFTHARCHIDDLFNKEVARHITDTRAEHAKTDERIVQHLGGIPLIRNTHLLAEHVISICDGGRYFADSPIIIRYLQTELNGLANSLQELFRLRAQEEHKAHLWEGAIRAMHTVSVYADQGR